MDTFSFYGKCIVKDCPGKLDCEDPTVMFGFPKDESLLKIWKEVLGLPSDEKLSSGRRICNRHFGPKLIKGKRLRCNAVPTLNLGPDAPPCTTLINVDVEESDERKCCMSNCPGGKNVRLFRFPKEKERRMKWLRHCNMEKNNWQKSKLVICEKHFTVDALGKRRLRKGANPKQSEEVNELNTSKEQASPATDPYENLEFIEGEMCFEELEQFAKSKNSTESIADLCSDECRLRRACAEKEQNYHLMIKKCQLEIDELRAQIQAIDEELKNVHAKAILPYINVSEPAFLFAKMICGSPNKEYTEEEKILAQDIHHLSHEAYEVMRNEFGFQLPHPSCFHLWDPSRMEHQSSG